MERNHSLKADFGMYDYYKFYINKYNREISRPKYNKLITEYNLGIIELILNDNLDYQLPYLNMEIVIRKDKRKPKLVNGKLINNIPIDWKKTNELWEKDQEAKDKKLLVRYNNSHTSGHVYRVTLKKFKSKVRNKSLYKLKTNRKFQRMLTERINDPKKEPFDAFLLY